MPGNCVLYFYSIVSRTGHPLHKFFIYKGMIACHKKNVIPAKALLQEKSHPRIKCRRLHALFPVTVISEKSNYTMARQEKSTLHHPSRNRATLLPPSPLRTVREAFTAYSSSSLNANSITRQQNRKQKTGYCGNL